MMDPQYVAPYEAPLEAVLVERRRFAQATHPDLDIADFAVLQNGPRAYKVAVHWVIRSRNTGEIKHHSVKIESYKRLKGKDGWFQEPDHTVTLSDNDSDEIARLTTFLAAVRGAT